jgi:DNA-binding transcriptional ArsR family regulator
MYGFSNLVSWDTDMESMSEHRFGICESLTLLYTVSAIVRLCIDISRFPDIINGMDPILIFKALSNETRLKILEWLKEPAKHFPAQEGGDSNKIGVCVSHIQEKAGLSQSTVSQYLLLLHRAGLLQANRYGQWTYYKRKEETIQELADYMKDGL